MRFKQESDRQGNQNRASSHSDLEHILVEFDCVIFFIFDSLERSFWNFRQLDVLQVLVLFNHVIDRVANAFG